jgi:hypothetical protein
MSPRDSVSLHSGLEECLSRVFTTPNRRPACSSPSLIAVTKALAGSSSAPVAFCQCAFSSLIALSLACLTRSGRWDIPPLRHRLAHLSLDWIDPETYMGIRIRLHRLLTSLMSTARSLPHAISRFAMGSSSCIFTYNAFRPDICSCRARPSCAAEASSCDGFVVSGEAVVSCCCLLR